jgi:hypothetical protein
MAMPAHAASPVSEDGHLVRTPLVAERLAAKAAERDAQVRLVEDALSTPVAQSQARALGVNLDRVKSAVPHLSDSELADLSQRATNVKDLAAGHRHGDGLVIAAVVLLIVALVVVVAAAGGYDYYDDDYCDCY